MKKGYTYIPEGQVHYVEEGEGEPLLLIHQTPQSSEEYMAIIPILSRSYRVIAMDSMGYGNSDLPPLEYEIEDFGRSVNSFLDAMGIPKTNLMGHHTGAAISVEVASRYPERVDKLVLSACPNWPPEERTKMLETSRWRSTELDREGEFLMNTWQTYASFSPNMGPDLWIKPFINSLKTRTRNPYNTHLAVARYHLDSRLPLIKCPTLLVIGSRDMFVDWLQDLKNLVPRSRTQIIEDGGVLTCFEKPEELSAAVLNFLEYPAV